MTAASTATAMSTGAAPRKAVLLCAGRRRVTEARVRELEMLAEAAQLKVAAVVHARRAAPHPKYYVGLGRVAEIQSALAETGADVLLVNRDFSPRQEHNLERECAAPVTGYTRLILEIFSRHARSYEGKLQVELAQTQYMATRLVRGWSHLERQKGGIGLRGGPGEQQLETDRRLLRRRILRLRAQLDLSLIHI